MNFERASDDRKQKVFGWLSLSAIAHVGFLMYVLFASLFEHHQPKPKHRLAELPGSRTSIEIKQAAEPKFDVILADAPTKPLAPKPRPVAQETVEPSDVIVALPKSKKIHSHSRKIAAQPPVRLPTTLPPSSRPLKRERLEQPEKLMDPYQPESIPSVPDQETASQVEPEKLSPVIADGIETPPPADQALADQNNTVADELKAEQAEAANQTAPAAEASTMAFDSLPPKPQSAEAAAPITDSRANDGAIVDASLRKPVKGNPLPQYPNNDRFAGRQGTAVVIGRVGKDGRVSQVAIERSSGSASIDRASLSAFQGWRFAPGPEARVRKSFAFSLQGEAKTLKARIGSGS